MFYISSIFYKIRGTNSLFQVLIYIELQGLEVCLCMGLSGKSVNHDRKKFFTLPHPKSIIFLRIRNSKLTFDELPFFKFEAEIQVSNFFSFLAITIYKAKIFLFIGASKYYQNKSNISTIQVLAATSCSNIFQFPGVDTQGFFL